MRQPLGSGSLKGVGAEASALCAFDLPLPSPLLHFIFLLCPQCRRPATMVKDKTAALERAKKATGEAKGKKTNRGSSSRSALPPGWIQGDWIRSSLWPEDLEELADFGLIAARAARLPEGEM